MMDGLSEPNRFQTTCFRSRTRLQKVAENVAELKPIVFANNRKSTYKIFVSA